MKQFLFNHKHKLAITGLAIVIILTIIGISVGAHNYNSKKSAEVHDNLFPCNAIGCCGTYCVIVNISYNHNATFRNDTYNYNHEFGPCKTFLAEYKDYPLYCQRLNDVVYTTKFYEDVDWVFDHIWLFIFLFIGIVICLAMICGLCMGGWNEITSPCTGYQQIQSEV